MLNAVHIPLWGLNAQFPDHSVLLPLSLSRLLFLYALKSTRFIKCNIVPVMFSFIKFTLIKHGFRQQNQDAK